VGGETGRSAIAAKITNTNGTTQGGRAGLGTGVTKNVATGGMTNASVTQGRVAKMVRHAGFTLEELMGHDRERRQPAPFSDDGARRQPQTDWRSPIRKDEDRLENDLIG